jgi:hypothetical protein
MKYTSRKCGAAVLVVGKVIILTSFQVGGNVFFEEVSEVPQLDWAKQGAERKIKNIRLKKVDFFLNINELFGLIFRHGLNQPKV